MLSTLFTHYLNSQELSNVTQKPLYVMNVMPTIVSFFILCQFLTPTQMI